MSIVDQLPPSLKRPVAGQPAYVWLGGGTVVLVGGYILWKRRKARMTTTTSSTLTPADGGNYPGYGAYDAPLPGWGAISGALGGLGGSSPTGPLLGYTSDGTPVYGKAPDVTGVPQQPSEVVGSGQAPPPQPEQAPPAPVVQASTPAQQPRNEYTLGQVVNPLSGERIVSSILSPLYGWINATNMGGVYTSGGERSISSLPYGGSYLGYVQSKYGSGTPLAMQEIALHGNFTGAEALPGGGYQLRNAAGETYAFA